MEHNDRMSLAWHIARLNAYAPQKARDFTKLDDLMLDPGRPARKPKQSGNQQIDALRAIMASRRR